MGDNVRIRQQRRRAGIIVATFVLIAMAWTVVASPFAGARRAKRTAPTLVVTHRDPVTVSGHGFKPRTRVSVTLAVPQPVVRLARANARGNFSVAYPAVIDRCSSWSVSARQGDQAVVVLRGPKPECAPI